MLGFACECGRSFSHQNDLGAHRQLCPSASLAFHCSVCQRGFAVRGALIQHELKAHQIAPPAGVRSGSTGFFSFLIPLILDSSVLV